MIGDFPDGHGCLEGPVSPHNYKRAVYRQAPLKFTVELLGPQKQGGNYSFGMMIRPLLAPDHRASISTSRRPPVGYEVWRRWEDCLWLQEILEMEYERLARQKRQRLEKGKGVKKNGIYLHGQAASFDSLPPGPDPKSIAYNIHDTIPRLSKKGTLFRASLSLIEQRQREFTALIEGLFKDDVPTLIQELRESRIVTDFFGYWRRDYDLAQKTGRRDPTLPRTSFSSAHSAESDQSSILPRRPLSVITVTRPPPPPRVQSAGAMMQSTRLSSDEDLPRSSLSSNSSSPSSRDSIVAPSPSNTGADDNAIIVNHGNGKMALDYVLPNHRAMVALESLPEDTELSTKPNEKPLPARPRPRRRSIAAEVTLGRSNSVGSERDRTSPMLSSRRAPPSRESWMSGVSVLDGLGIVLPDSPMPSSPMSLSSNRRRSSFGNGCRRPLSSMSDEERYSDVEEDLIDPQLYDAFPMPGPLLGAHLGPPITRHARSTTNLPLPSPTFPPSPSSVPSAFSPLSMSPNLSGPSMLAKAAYASVIVLLRLSCDSPLCLVRSKMKEKFSSQGVELGDSFALYFVVPLHEDGSGGGGSGGATNGLLPPSITSGKPRQRTSTLSMSLTDSTRLRIIRSQSDWEGIVEPFDGAKVTLRVMDEEMEKTPS
ncbi:hypothetical protein ONZ45_g9028 [Pleurotus djamor]|nr:hypothetical protein ONZ45_g9028 [Pleurotus djamor]